MKKRFGILTMIVVIILAASTTMAITAGYMRAKYDKVSENLQAQEKAFTKMAEINKLLRERYIGDIDETALNNGMASGVISGLDDAYAKYYSVEDYARLLKLRLKLRFCFVCNVCDIHNLAVNSKFCHNVHYLIVNTN